MVLPRFVEQALAGEPLTIYGDGRQSRCFTSVHDAINAVEGLLKTDSPGAAAYNVGVSEAVRIDELARRVIARVGSSSGVIHVPYADAYGEGYEELGSRVPDTSALDARTGWQPGQTLDQTIDEVIGSRAPQPRAARKRAGLGRLRPIPVASV
jgi:UDP-glucose 4-epimerase